MNNGITIKDAIKTNNCLGVAILFPVVSSLGTNPISPKDLLWYLQVGISPQCFHKITLS